MLIDKGYSCKDIDNEIKKALEKHRTKKMQEHEKRGPDTAQQYQNADQIQHNSIKTAIKQNIKSTKYATWTIWTLPTKKDEKVLSGILKNVVPKEGRDTRLVLYYKSKNTSNLFLQTRETELTSIGTRCLQV